jgi:hypothetical protein
VTFDGHAGLHGVVATNLDLEACPCR